MGNETIIITANPVVAQYEAKIAELEETIKQDAQAVLTIQAQWQKKIAELESKVRKLQSWEKNRPNREQIAELEDKLESANSFINTAPTSKWKADAIREMLIEMQKFGYKIAVEVGDIERYADNLEKSDGNI